jgi:ribonuclease T2
MKVLRQVFAAMAALMSVASAHAQEQRPLDYYALALSWSPTYCATQGRKDKEQCGLGRSFAFVVHGLWPQYDKGWPQSCSTDENWVPQEQINEMLDIMPSRKLVIHEWKKHGTCAGLRQQDYFDLTRALFAKVKIPARYLSPTQDVTITPDQLVADFVKTNVGLTPDMLSVQCGKSRETARLTELRVCFSNDGKFEHCGENENHSCRARNIIMPRVRGG